MILSNQILEHASLAPLSSRQRRLKQLGLRCSHVVRLVFAVEEGKTKNLSQLGLLGADTVVAEAG